MKTFKVAGVSRLKGAWKVRVANDMTRVKVLQKAGHDSIDLIELKNPMAKEDIVAYLLSIDFATRDGVTNADVQAALLAEVDKRSEKAPKAKAEPKAKAAPSLENIAARKPKTKAAPKSTITRKEIEAQLEGLEESPF